MRQVFSSARIENAEAVAQLLHKAGIEARVVNGRGWRGAIRGNFTYRGAAGDVRHPSVWVVRSQDHPPARALLREHGLLESARAPDMSYLPPSVHADKIGRSAGTSAQRRVARINLLLVVLIAALAGLSLFGARRLGYWTSPGTHSAPATAPAALPTVSAPMPVTLAAVHQIPTPPMLAETLALREAPSPQHPVCLAIDSTDPTADTLQRLRRTLPNVRPASQCAAQIVRIEVAQYRTDGSGVGTVQLRVVPPAASAREQTLQVQREGMHWRVLPHEPRRGTAE